MSQAVADVVTEIRDTIVQYGWTRAAYGNPDRGFCILGAGSHLARNGRVPMPLVQQAFQAIAKALPPVVIGHGCICGGCVESAVAQWNDHIAPSKQAVVEMLNQVIMGLRMQEQQAPVPLARERVWTNEGGELRFSIPKAMLFADKGEKPHAALTIPAGWWGPAPESVAEKQADEEKVLVGV